MKISFAMGKGHGGEGQAHVGRGAEGIAGQYAQTAAVRRDLRNDSDLHGEVSDYAAFCCFFRGEVLRTINKAHL